MGVIQIVNAAVSRLLIDQPYSDHPLFRGFFCSQPKRPMKLPQIHFKFNCEFFR